MASISANGSKGNHKFTLNVTETGTSVENNTSTISFSFVLSSLGGGYDWDFENNVPVTYSVVINGTKYTGNIMSYNGSSTVTIRSEPLTVAHNTDGNKTIAFSFSVSSLDYSYLPGSANASGSMALSFIARASQPSLITKPENTQNVGDFGTTIDIYMNQKSTAFTHTVRYEFGSRSGTIATGVKDKTTWKIPLDLMNLIPNATSGSGRVFVDTYNGSTLIGTKYSGFTATVPESVIPTVGMTLEDITGVDDIYGSPVKGLSKIKVTVNATPAYSSPIDTYLIYINGVSYQGKEATSGFLNGGNSSNFVMVGATDKRGRTGQKSYTMNVQDYTPPAVTALAAIRCNADGTANKKGGYVKVTFSAAVSSMNGKNTASYSIRYKRTSESNYTEVNLTELANNYAPTDKTYIFAASVAKSYDVVVSATDRHNASNPATKSTKAPTAASVFSWRGFKNSSGNKEDGAGIGKVPEKPNCLQVGWEAEFEKEIYYKGKTLLDFFYPVGSIYTAYNHTDPSTLFGGTWERIENRFLWATTPGGIIGRTGGESEHKLTVAEMPSHTHTVPGGYGSGSQDASKFRVDVNSPDGSWGNVSSTGGGAAHNNMPPYIQVSMWRRTA